MIAELEEKMLEWAAKSIGINTASHWFWNPLFSSEDAFNLAVKHNLFQKDCFYIEHCEPGDAAAMRRAITMAAAEIGQDMP